jgi:hypothetical protein
MNGSMDPRGPCLRQTYWSGKCSVSKFLSWLYVTNTCDDSTISMSIGYTGTSYTLLKQSVPHFGHPVLDLPSKP